MKNMNNCMEEFIESNKLCAIFFTTFEFDELNKKMNYLKKEIGNNSKYSEDINLLLSQTKRCSDILKKFPKINLKRITL